LFESVFESDSYGHLWRDSARVFVCPGYDIQTPALCRRMPMMTHNADLATAQLIGRVQRQDLDMDDLRYFLKSPSTTAAVIREVSLAEGWWLHQSL